MSVKTGEIFNRSQAVQDDLQKLTDYYKDQGYAYVNVTPPTPVDEKTRIVDVIVRDPEGAAGHFERINIRGNTKTRDKVIRREMQIIEGEHVQQQPASSSRSAASTALGFFEKVDVSTKRGSTDDKMEVNVEVTERPTGTFQIGAGFSSVENFIAQAQISQNNLFGRGQPLTLQAQLSSLRQLFLLQFHEPYFLDTNWTFGFNLFNQDQYLSVVRTARSRAAASPGATCSPTTSRLFLTLHAGGRRHLDQRPFTGFFSGAAAQPIADRHRSPTCSAPASRRRAARSLSYDTRDNRLFPTSGWYNTLSGEFADNVPAVARTCSPATRRSCALLLPALGAVRAARSRPTPASSPAATRAACRSSSATSSAASTTSAASRRARSGPRHPRAPASRRPGLDAAQLPVGGNMQVIGNAEIEFPIFEKVGIRASCSPTWATPTTSRTSTAGSSRPTSTSARTPASKPLNLSAFRASWGFGFRWFSPIGPLRFEWGIPFRTLPGRGAHRLRVHHRQLFLNRVKQTATS